MVNQSRGFHTMMPVNKADWQNQACNNYLETKLSHGKVIMWSQGEACELTGNQTMIAKEILIKNNIDFEEQVITTDTAGPQQSLIKGALAMHSGYH